MEIVYWLILNIILLIIILILICILFLHKIIKVINFRIWLIRRFIDENEGLFSIFFIFLFAIEQIILIYLIHKYEQNSSALKLIVSTFALIIISTASLQKFVLETKIKYEKRRKNVIEKAINIIKRLKERKLKIK